MTPSSGSSGSKSISSTRSAGWHRAPPLPPILTPPHPSARVSRLTPPPCRSSRQQLFGQQIQDNARALFEAADTDGSGTIDRYEFRCAHGLGQTPPPHCTGRCLLGCRRVILQKHRRQTPPRRENPRCVCVSMACLTRGYPQEGDEADGAGAVVPAGAAPLTAGYAVCAQGESYREGGL